VELIQNNAQAIFKDQLGDTYITFLDLVPVGHFQTPSVQSVQLHPQNHGEMDTLDTLDASTDPLFSSPKDILLHLKNNNIPPHIQSKNHRESVQSVQSAQNFAESADTLDTSIIKVSTVGDRLRRVLRTYRINSREVKQWVAKLYYNYSGKTPGMEAIRSAGLVVEAGAVERRRMYNRVAPDGRGGIWWDMADYLGRAIHITKEGWEIVDNPPQIFKRYSHQQPLPEPADKGSLKPLLDYVVLSDVNEQLLKLVTPLTYLIPEVPHVVEILSGPRGATKSSSQRFLKMVVDPSVSPLLSMPGDINQMVQHTCPLSRRSRVTCCAAWLRGLVLGSGCFTRMMIW